MQNDKGNASKVISEPTFLSFLQSPLVQTLQPDKEELGSNPAWKCLEHWNAAVSACENRCVNSILLQLHDHI